MADDLDGDGTVLALSGSFVWLAVMSTLTRLLTYIVCIAALPRLEKTTEPVENQFTLPGGLLIPAIALLLCLWLISFASLAAWLTTLGLMGNLAQVERRIGIIEIDALLLILCYFAGLGLLYIRGIGA